MARTKLENLTHSWMGYAIVSAVVTLLANGVGVLPLVFAAVSAFIGVWLSLWIGRHLLARSTTMRTAVIGLSVFGLCLSALGFASMLLHPSQIFAAFSLAFLMEGAVGVVGFFLTLRSLNVLTDPDVRAYFER